MNFPGFPFLNAHNSIYKYDIISLCETGLIENKIVPENILQGYHYYGCNHSSGEKKGGIGIRTHYNKNRPISFNEYIVVELRFGRKKNSLQWCIDIPITKLIVLKFWNLPITLGLCTRKSQVRNHLFKSLQVTLMLIQYIGG